MRGCAVGLSLPHGNANQKWRCPKFKPSILVVGCAPLFVWDFAVTVSAYYSRSWIISVLIDSLVTLHYSSLSTLSHLFHVSFTSLSRLFHVSFTSLSFDWLLADNSMARSRFLERESSNRTRRHVGIPIPSFATTFLPSTLASLITSYGVWLLLVDDHTGYIAKAVVDWGGAREARRDSPY